MPRSRKSLLRFAQGSVTLRLDDLTLRLLRPRGFSARAVGLLNHLSLPSGEGLIFGRSLFFHTFGMRFPILVVCLGDDGRQVARPRVIPPGRFFACPLRAAHVLEVNPEHEVRFLGLWMAGATVSGS